MKFLKKENILDESLSKDKSFWNNQTLPAFTLAELIVAVLIWTLVLSILMSFITTSMNEISYSNRQTKVIEKINSFSTSVNNYKWTFAVSTVLVNNTGTWSDVLMLVNPEETEWIILGVVSGDSLELENLESDYELISKKYMGIRQLTTADIVTLKADPNTAFSLNFNEDKLFKDLIMKDFQAESYNWWAIIDTDLRILINYKESVDWEKWESITNDWIYKINMNF